MKILCQLPFLFIVTYDYQGVEVVKNRNTVNGLQLQSLARAVKILLSTANIVQFRSREDL